MRKGRYDLSHEGTILEIRRFTQRLGQQFAVTATILNLHFASERCELCKL